MPDCATPRSPRPRVGHTLMHDRASLNRVDRSDIVALRRRSQPWGNELAPCQVHENDRDEDQSDHRNANERADESGEKPPYKHAEKDPHEKSETTPLKAPTLGPADAIA